MLLAGIIMIIVIITAGVNIVKNNRKKAEQAAVTKAKQEKLFPDSLPKDPPLQFLFLRFDTENQNSRLPNLFFLLLK